jgi:hypothetical protein
MINSRVLIIVIEEGVVFGIQDRDWLVWTHQMGCQLRIAFASFILIIHLTYGGNSNFMSFSATDWSKVN